jgi:NADH:ubiquinone oxidoreductase subunit 4 (subunit M)
LISIVVLGLYPRLIFGVTEEAVRGVVAALGGG